MSSLATISEAFVPIAAVILLGVLAGRAGIIDPGNNVVLADLVLDFCLPATLFAAIATMSLAELSEWRFFLGIALGLLSVFAAALALALLVFRKPVAEAALQALNGATPTWASWASRS